MFEYEDVKKLAREVKCKVTDLTVLALGNDPFYAGVPYRRERAEWFAELWDRFGFQHGVHLRRIHYVLVSQPEPIRWPNGKPYENTENDWTVLDTASLAARYLGLIPPDVLIDRRNPDPLIRAKFSFGPEPSIYLTGAAIDIDLPSEFPVSGLGLTGFYRDLSPPPTAIRSYAERYDMEVVKTYSDAGKSGLKIEGRNALRHLIDDVEGGDAGQFPVLRVRCSPHG